MELPQVVTEYVPAGETVENWSELITVHSIIGAAQDSTAEDFIALIRDPLLDYCPSAMWNVIRQSPDELVAEWRTIGCVGPFDSDDQYELVRVVWGSWAVLTTAPRHFFRHGPTRSQQSSPDGISSGAMWPRAGSSSKRVASTFSGCTKGVITSTVTTSHGWLRIPDIWSPR